MNNFFLKLTCFLTGYDYQVLKNYDSWSRRKIAIYAISMMFPTTIWILNGYLLTTKVLAGPLWAGLLVSFICGALIFFIERVIVMSSGNWIIGFIRLILALSISILGSFAIKEVIFEKDINNKLAELRLNNSKETKAKIDSKYKEAHDFHLAALQNYQKQWDDLMNKANLEAAGKLSGRRNPGPITAFYIARANAIRQNFIVPEQAKLDAINSASENEFKAYEKNQAENEGLWTRIDVFIQMTMKDKKNIFVFCVFFTFFLCIELFV